MSKKNVMVKSGVDGMSHLSMGNKALRDQQYEQALDCFKKAVAQDPSLISFLKYNIELVNRRLAGARSTPSLVSCKLTSGTPGLANLHQLNTKNAESTFADYTERSEWVKKASVQSLSDFPKFDILINCWLRNRESLHDLLMQLYRSLELKGLRCCFVTHTPDFIENECVSSLSCSFLLYKDRYVDTFGEYLDCCPDWLKEVVGVERRRLLLSGRENTGNNKSYIKKYVASAYFTWKQYLLNQRPKLFFIWGSTSSMSKLLIRLCRDIGIPYIVLERGHFPGLLSLDLGAQFGHGMTKLLPKTLPREDGDQYKKIEEYLSGITERAYSSKNLDDVIDLDVLSRCGKRVVVVIGVNDYGSGTAYLKEDTHEMHSGMFHSSREVASYFSSHLSNFIENCIVVFKPHPADRSNYDNMKHEAFVVAADHDISGLIRAADVCVTLSTTSVAACIVEKKPIVMLGFSDISLCDVAYECTSHSEIIPTVRSALDGDRSDIKLSNGRRFLIDLFTSRLLGADPSVPTSMNIDNFSNYVSSYICAHPFYMVDRISERKIVAPIASGLLPIQPLEDESYSFSSRISVVIPVYSDLDSLTLCMEWLSKADGFGEFDVIFVWDCGPDAQILEALHYFCKGKANCVVLENSRNVGFSGAVNRGILNSINRDVIILNSDAIVSRRFAVKLYEAAYSSKDIATVTPVSNNAGIFTYGGSPFDLTGNCDSVSAYDSLINSSNTLVEVPSGHGFCMYIKRSAISRVGVFDEATYGRGYYEEIDFCLRARALGMKNYCSTNTFVGHFGAVSFKEEAIPLRDRNRERLRKKYPEYFKERRKFVADNPIEKVLRASRC